MSYYDIAGKIEVISASSPREISNRLLYSLQSKGTSVTIQEENALAFETQFIKSVTRGYIFQGITSGIVKISKSNTDQLTLEYKLTTLPIRIFIILMVPWIVLGMPIISHYLADRFNYINYLSFAVPVLITFSIVILASQYFIKYKFSSFLKKSLAGTYSQIKQSSRTQQFDIKRVVLVSCSGILVLACSIPIILLIGFFNVRSKVVWQFPLQGAVMVPPLIHGNAIYFGSLEDSGPSAFYALEKETGNLLWKRELNGGVSSSPIMAHDLVCFSADDGVFRCLHQEDGSVVWEFGPDQRNLNASDCDRCALKLNSPLFDGNTIYVGSHDHNAYALDSRSGQLMWSFPANGSVFSSPTLDNGFLYIGSQDGNIYVLDPKSGTELRHYSIPSRNAAGEESGIYATPIVDENTIYVINGTLTGVDLESGAIKWQVLDSSNYGDQIIGNPISFGDTIIVSAVERIRAVDKATGNIKWEFSRIKGGVFFTPTLYEEIIYFGDSNGYLYGVNANNGSQVFRYNMNNLDFSSYTNLFPDFTFPPSTDGNTIFVKWLNSMYGIQSKN